MPHDKLVEYLRGLVEEVQRAYMVTWAEAVALVDAVERPRYVRREGEYGKD